MTDTTKLREVAKGLTLEPFEADEADHGGGWCLDCGEETTCVRGQTPEPGEFFLCDDCAQGLAKKGVDAAPLLAGVADELDALRAEVAAVKAAVHEAEATVCDGRHATAAGCVKAMAAERNHLADVALRLGGEVNRLTAEVARYAANPSDDETRADACDNCEAPIDGNTATTSDVCWDCWRSLRDKLTRLTSEPSGPEVCALYDAYHANINAGMLNEDAMHGPLRAFLAGRAE